MDIEALQNTPGHIGPLEIAPRARNEPIWKFGATKILPNVFARPSLWGRPKNPQILDFSANNTIIGT